jgi:hypothetical protein
MLRNLLLLSITLALSAQSKKEPELNIIEDAEAYNVYSAILDMEKPKGELLIADTTVPFNQCLDPHSDEPVDAAIQDYKKANQNQWHVGYHFVSTQPYKLLSRKEANTLLQRDRRTGDWSLSPYNGIHRFSAVGFSAN